MLIITHIQICLLIPIFHRLPELNEIYTRSTSNYWVVGRRVASVKTPKNGHRNAAQQDPGAEDTRELYMVAAKKDSTLVDVEGKFGMVNKWNFGNYFKLLT